MGYEYESADDYDQRNQDDQNQGEQVEEVVPESHECCPWGFARRQLVHFDDLSVVRLLLHSLKYL